jgi:transposase
MNTKLHAVTDAEGRPIRFFMTAGQVRSATTSGQLPCWAVCQRQIGCWPTGVTMPTGSEMR